MVPVERYHGLPHSTSVAVVCLAMRPLGSCRRRFAGAGSKLQSKGPKKGSPDPIESIAWGFNFTRSVASTLLDRSRGSIGAAINAQTSSIAAAINAQTSQL